MASGNTELRKVLEKACAKSGAKVFGIVSVDDADALPRIRIGSTINAYSKKIRSFFPDAESIVMFGIASEDDADEISVRREDGSWFYPGYASLPKMQSEVIDILKGRGFKTMTPPERVPHKRLAVLAGFGAYGKNSMILSKEHGLWLRFYCVVTDAKLPKSKMRDKDLCRGCERCVRACPTKAIASYKLDWSRCLVHIEEIDRSDTLLVKNIPKHVIRLTPNSNRMCTTCQMVCPYTTDERRKNAMHGLRNG